MPQATGLTLLEQDLESALATIPSGYGEGVYEGLRCGVTCAEVSRRKADQPVRASARGGGGDVVSFDPVSSTVSCLGPSPCHSARKLPRKPALQRRPSRIRAESGRRAVSTASKMSQDGLSAARGFRPSHSAQSYGLLVCFHSAGRVALISATVVPSLDPSAGAVLQ